MRAPHISLLVVLGMLVLGTALLAFPLSGAIALAAQRLPPGGAWKDPAWGDPPDRAFRRHRITGHEHAPNVDVWVPLAEHAGGGFRFRTNDLGLRRDRNTSIDKDWDVFRVLVLGDSQTDGYVENSENLSSVMEGVLSGQVAAAGKRIEVLNGAVAGYGPAQEFLWYDAHGAELQPDLVVLVFYPGNDVLDVLDPTKPGVDLATGRVIRAREESPAGEVGEGLGGLAGAEAYSTDTLIEVLRTCHGCFLQSLQQAARARLDPDTMRWATGRAAAILALLNNEVRGKGSNFVVALLPTPPQATPAIAGPMQQNVGARLGLYDSDLVYDDEVTRQVLDQLSWQGVLSVDLRPALTTAGQGGALYYSRDWHLNPLGHHAAGTELAWRLVDLGLLP